MQKWLVAGLLVAGLSQVNAQESGILVKFEGGIGVQPVANVVGPVNPDGTFPNVARNIVRGVEPAGPWRIADLGAIVTTDGRIRVRGRGLLLAGGISIGQNANQRVFATLICEGQAPFTQHSSPAEGVELEPNGDFSIDDELSSVPDICASPVLLIRSAGSRSWFAAGIVKADGQN